MGLFSGSANAKAPDYSYPGDVAVIPEVAAALPDPGHYLLDCLSDLHESSQLAAREEFDRVRHANGGLPSIFRRGIPSKPSSGPLYLLNWITNLESITVQVWASNGLRFGSKRSMEAVALELVDQQGVPAAASWVLGQRGNDVLGLDFLAHQLSNGYEEWAGNLTNGMVIDSFKKWKR